ncbi:MAG TPA: ABC transporter substrate-binding protein [Burkholderiales bacterium]|nr:ABC transporter substrate-binding protein [Burkholderiales bacterium]
MRRLTFTCILTIALFAVLRPVAAQQSRDYRIGVIHQGGSYAAAIDGLRDGLSELGFEEGKQFRFHVRDVRGDHKAIAAAARSLEGDKVDLIWALATSTTLAVTSATKNVPIVFYVGTDPVAIGLVTSFRRPGGRFTGVHNQVSDLTEKGLELLKEMVPRTRRVLALYNPDNPAAQRSAKIAREAARKLKVELVERPVGSVEELRAALHALRPGEVDAIAYVADAMVASQAELVIETARAQRLPTMFQDKESVDKGALASYGESRYSIGRRSAKHVRQVLLGANPGDLPVEQVDRVNLVINLKTAKALGITIPQSVLARADQVIE